MSGWHSKAIKREIKPGANDPTIRPIGVILHVTAGTGGGEAIFRYFRDDSGGIESHFMIEKDGDVYQYREAGREADANYKANSFILEDVRRGYISVETQGLESGEWTDAQLASIKELLLWANKTYGIPLEVCTGPKDAGVGYHVMFGAPGPWTPVSKSCPGPKRIEQFKKILTPWMKKNDPRNPPAPAPTTIPADLLAWLRDRGLATDGVTVDLSKLQGAARNDPDNASGTFTYKDGVAIVEFALKAEGLLDKSVVDGHFGTVTRSAYAAWQRSAAGGSAEPQYADGIPGPESLGRLGKRHGFKVVA